MKASGIAACADRKTAESPRARTLQNQVAATSARALRRLGAALDDSGLPDDDEAACGVLLDRAAAECDGASRALARMGAYLLAARARLPHGAFEPSCAARGISRQRAAEAMRAARLLTVAACRPDRLPGAVARRMLTLSSTRLEALARFDAVQLARLDQQAALDLIDGLAALPVTLLRRRVRKLRSAGLAALAAEVKQIELEKNREKQASLEKEQAPLESAQAPPSRAAEACAALAALAETQIAALGRQADLLPPALTLKSAADSDMLAAARAARVILAALDAVAARADEAARNARAALADWLAVDCDADENAAEPPAQDQRAHALEYDADILWEQAARRTETQRAKGVFRARVMGRLTRLLANGASRAEGLELTARAEGLNAGTVRNWYYGANGKPGAKHYHPRDWPAALIPAHTGRTALAEFSPEAWEFVKADYLRLEKPTLAACYQRLMRAAAAHGWTVPAARTVERRLLALPAAVRTLRREGEHALMRLFPAQQRSVRDIRAGEWINGDGYRHNVFVARADGSFYRPKTWFWQDVYSRRILAWRTDETEHGDMIRLAFGDAIERYGIPAHITIDNTRAVANKWLTGGVPNRYRFKVREEDPLGIFPLLGIEVHWTSIQAGKGHGQAKPVERAFGVGGVGEYVDKHPALAGAYTGPNPQAKPENYGGRGVELETFERVLAEEIRAWNARTGRRTEACRGELSFDQAFEESASGADIRRASPEQRRLWLLTAETVKVGRDGVLTLAAGAASADRLRGPQNRNRYGGEALLEHAGGRVAARFDPDRLHDPLHVYTLDGRYIGAAPCIAAAGFGDTAAAREHARARKQYIRGVKDVARAEQRMKTADMMRYLPADDPAADPAPGVVEVDFRTAKPAVAVSPAAAESDEETMSRNFDRLILAMDAEPEIEEEAV